jgi:hypothetical protein
MTDAIQHHLRDALTDRADAFPYDPAINRLAGVDYRPRNARRFSARVLGALSVSGAAVVAAAVALILTLGGTPTTALAGWTPAPKALNASQLSTIAHSVRAHWAQVCSGTGGSIVLADVRGPNTLALYVASIGEVTICRNGVAAGSGATGSAGVSPDRVRNALNTYGTLDPRPGVVSPNTFTEVGRAGVDVRSVSVLLSTGTKVQATVANGWYLVWWPAKAGYSKQLIITTNPTPGATGSHTYEIADRNGLLPGCGAGPATDATEVHTLTKIRPERLKLAHDGLSSQQQRTALNAWLRQNGYGVRPRERNPHFWGC